jgi:hypothetical protein
MVFGEIVTFHKQMMGQADMATADHLARSAGLSPAELSAEIDKGGRIVRFEYCISLLIVTLRREAGPVLIRPGRWAWPHSLPYNLISVVMGWWGIPWGLIFTPLTVWNNFRGGRDVSSQFRESTAPVVA